MPFYDYRCQACQHTFSHLHLGEIDAALKCPSCGSEDLKKLMAGFATVNPSPEPPCGGGCCGGCQHGGCAL